MKQIRMSFNLDNNTWLIQKVLIEPGNNIFNLILNSNNGFSDFNNFSCGFELDQGTTKILSKNYPLPGYRYQYVEQEILDAEIVELKYNHRYIINCWLDNNNQRYETLSEFVVPAPPKPFETWVWQDDKWIPPIPYPGNDQVVYQWSESEQIWIEGPPTV